MYVLNRFCYSCCSVQFIGHIDAQTSSEYCVCFRFEGDVRNIVYVDAQTIFLNMMFALDLKETFGTLCTLMHKL
jgi:hypothetical protein